MHHPPAVRLLVGTSPWARRLACAVSGLASLQVWWFFSLNWKLGWQAALVAVSFMLALIRVWLTTPRPATGTLCWDGRQWQWSGFTDGVCLLQRHLDFQVLMLVSLQRPADRTVWLWLQRSHDPHQWLALRRAVVHSVSPGPAHRTGQGAQAQEAVTP